MAGRLARIRSLLNEENSHDELIPRSIDVTATFFEEKELVKRLAETKTAIAMANTGIVGKIIELAEAKSAISWLNSMSTREGVYEESYSNRHTYVAEIKKNDVMNEVNALQRHMEDLQDEIDAYNATKKVIVEIDD